MATKETINPLTERHYTQLKGLQKRIKATREFIIKCKNCKLDVDEELKATDDQLAIIAALLKEFFPHQPG